MTLLSIPLIMYLTTNRSNTMLKTLSTITLLTLLTLGLASTLIKPNVTQGIAQSLRIGITR